MVLRTGVLCTRMHWSLALAAHVVHRKSNFKSRKIGRVLIKMASAAHLASRGDDQNRSHVLENWRWGHSTGPSTKGENWNIMTCEFQISPLVLTLRNLLPIFLGSNIHCFAHYAEIRISRSLSGADIEQLMQIWTGWNHTDVWLSIKSTLTDVLDPCADDFQHYHENLVRVYHAWLFNHERRRKTAFALQF